MKQATVHLGTFNLYNLVLPNKKYYGSRTYSKEEFSKKKAWIGQQLIDMNVDIVGFQEIFHEEALSQIIQEQPNLNKGHWVVANANGNSPAVGLYSRYPIASYEVIEHFPEQLEVGGMLIPFKTFSRPILKVRVQITKQIYLIVFVVHLKSKRPKFSENANREDPIELAKGEARSLLLRSAEASALRTILMDTLQNRDHPVVVLGDLNDTHTSVTTQLISGQPPWRNLPIEKKNKYWDVLLYHAKDIQARQSYKDVYYTHIHNGHYESLDHIMLSQELVQENSQHIGRVGLVKVFNDHIVDQTLTNLRTPSWKSDHAQVSVSLELNLKEGDHFLYK